MLYTKMAHVLSFPDSRNGFSERFLKVDFSVSGYRMKRCVMSVFDILRQMNNSQKTSKLKVAQRVFQGQYLPSLNINYVAINKNLGTFQPQLYLIEMEICYDQGYNDIRVVTETK